MGWEGKEARRRAEEATVVAFTFRKRSDLSLYSGWTLKSLCCIEIEWVMTLSGRNNTIAMGGGDDHPSKGKTG